MMRRFGALLAIVVMGLAACSPPGPGDAAKSLIEQRLNSSDGNLRTPLLRPDLSCLKVANTVTVDEAGHVSLTPDAQGHFKSVINEDEGFRLEYAQRLRWQVDITDVQEPSPGAAEVSYRARLNNPPNQIVLLWFELCSSEPGVEAIAVSREGLQRLERAGDGEWQLR